MGKRQEHTPTVVSGSEINLHLYYIVPARLCNIITPRAHARSGVKQSVLSVSLSVSVSSAKFGADHDNEGSKHF